MNKSELKQILRQDFANKIIPLVKKDECEICGASVDLEVHHMVTFCELIDNVLERLNITSDEFSEDEVSNIRTMMLGTQLQNESITLCEECHTRIHSEKGGFSAIGNGYKIYVEKQRLIKEKQRLQDIENAKIYLESIVGKRLFKEEQKELIENINLRVDGKQQKSYNKLNAYFSSNNMPYLIVTKRGSERIDGKVKSYRYWVVINNME